MLRLVVRGPWGRGARSYTTGATVWGHDPVAESVEQAALAPELLAARAQHSNAWRLVTAYRRHGHRFADINPVAPAPGLGVELEVERFGLRGEDTVEAAGLLAGREGSLTVGQLRESLQELYCGGAALEADYLEQEEEQEWLYNR